MNSAESIQRICSLPVTFRGGDQSAYDLVRNSGAAHRCLTAEALLPVLQSNPDLVDAWLMWSEDQRCTPAYYFIEEGEKYVVGRYPGKDRAEFDDRLTACADFIVKAVNLIW